MAICPDCGTEFDADNETQPCCGICGFENSGRSSVDDNNADAWMLVRRDKAEPDNLWDSEGQDDDYPRDKSYILELSGKHQIILKKFIGSEEDAVLPGKLLGRTVTKIGKNAFQNTFSLKRITLSSTITDIGEWAFSCCSNLSLIIFPEGLKRIEEKAFLLCANLIRVIIPGSVTAIKHNAFGGCAKLTEIGVADANRVYCSMDGVLFNKKMTVLIQYPGGRVGHYIVPDTVTGIRSGAFAACANLKSITIPESVERIGLGAFNGCTGLSAVMLPEHLSFLWEYAFYSCESLISVIVPAGIRHVGRGTFARCPKLNGLYFRGDAPSFDADAFIFSDNITVFYLPGTAGWGSICCGRPTALWNI